MTESEDGDFAAEDRERYPTRPVGKANIPPQLSKYAIDVQPTGIIQHVQIANR